MAHSYRIAESGQCELLCGKMKITPNPTHNMEEATTQSLEEDFEGQATHTVEGHLDCFQVLAITNNAAMHKVDQVHIHNGVLLNREKQRHHEIYRQMNGTRKCHAEL
ncbi:hypothetical protein STEG23_000275, partial [Scotinomys teguina]